MFTNFNEYLKEFESDDYGVDYWYDEGFSIAQDMLSEFSSDDWVKLEEGLLYASIGWKKRLAYCLHNNNNMQELSILLELFNTEDIELLELVVDSLRGFDTKECKRLIQKNSLVVTTVKEKIKCSSPIIAKVLTDFLIKLVE